VRRRPGGPGAGPSQAHRLRSVVRFCAARRRRVACDHRRRGAVSPSFVLAPSALRLGSPPTKQTLLRRYALTAGLALAAALVVSSWLYATVTFSGHLHVASVGNRWATSPNTTPGTSALAGPVAGRRPAAFSRWVYPPRPGSTRNSTRPCWRCSCGRCSCSGVRGAVNPAGGRRTDAKYRVQRLTYPYGVALKAIPPRTSSPRGDLLRASLVLFVAAFLALGRARNRLAPTGSGRRADPVRVPAGHVPEPGDLCRSGRSPGNRRPTGSVESPAAKSRRHRMGRGLALSGVGLTAKLAHAAWALGPATAEATWAADSSLLARNARHLLRRARLCRGR